MEGITSPELRQLVSSYGPLGLVCTEFVRIGASPLRPQLLSRHVVKVPHVPLSVQVMGNDPERLGEAAAALEAAGADIIDINLGCPTKVAAAKQVGAALLADPERLSRILMSLRAHTQGPLSIKMRAGFDPGVGSAAAVNVARIAEAAGVSYIVVHPRRRTDLYRGAADWSVVRDVAHAVSIPVVGNGDLWFADDALRLEERSGCAAVMLGRPAVRNPWIFRQIAELRSGHTVMAPSGRDLAAHVQRLDDVFRHLGPKRVGPLKEHLCLLLRAVKGQEATPHGSEDEPPRKPLARLLRLAHAEQVVDAACEALEPLEPDQLDLGLRSSSSSEVCPHDEQDHIC